MTTLPNPVPDGEPNNNPSPAITADDFARFRAELLAMFQGTVAAPVEAVPMDRLIAELMAFYRPPMRARATGVRILQVLRLVVDLGAETTADLTTELMCRLVASRPATESPHTTNSLLRSLRVACNFAVGKGWLRVSPFALRKPFLRVSAPKLEKQRHHSVATITRVLEIARADIARKLPGSPSEWRARRLYALVAICAYTGMRKNEVLHLRAEDIDIPGRLIHVVARDLNRLKTERSAQPIPMAEELAAILHEWLPCLAIPADWPERSQSRGPRPAWNPDGKRDPGWVIPNIDRTGPWIGGPVGWRPIDRLKRLGLRAGVEGFTFLSLRHSWATHAESRWGLSELQIQRVLRHTTVKTQKRYRHADLVNLREIVKGVGFGFGGQPSAPGTDTPAPEAPATAPPSDTSAPTLEPAEASAGSAPLPAIQPRNPSKPGVYHQPKLTPEDVAEARELRARGWQYAALRQRYGVSKSTLHAALYGLTHRNAGGPIVQAEGA